MGPMEEATKAFLKQATWLDASHKPMTVGLLILAKELDKSFQAATFAQYGLTFRWLAKQAPAGEQITDPLEALLASE